MPVCNYSRLYPGRQSFGKSSLMARNCQFQIYTCQSPCCIFIPYGVKWYNVTKQIGNCNLENAPYLSTSTSNSLREVHIEDISLSTPREDIWARTDWLCWKVYRGRRRLWGDQEVGRNGEQNMSISESMNKESTSIKQMQCSNF